VQLENVGLRYGRGPEILRDVSLSLEPGSFHFLTGASGAGKTSLLKLIYLAQPPSRGLISVFGKDVTQVPHGRMFELRRQIGVVFQEFRLLNHLDVFENVALPLRVTGQLRADYADDVAELLEWVGLGKRMRALPPTLSGGEKQRVAIARAVLAKPKILLADEPTGNVDPQMAARLVDLFVRLNRQGTTIIIATHSAELIRKVGAPVITISDGEIDPHGDLRT